MLDSFIESFQLLARQKTINRRQEHLSSLFSNLSKLMKEIKLKDKSDPNVNSSINDLIMKRPMVFLAMLFDSNGKLEFEFEKQGEILLDSLLRVEV